MKNEKQTSNLNFNVQLFWNLENYLFWCFLSQLQYRIQNQNFIFNLSKKRNGTLGTRIQILYLLVFQHYLPSSSRCKWKQHLIHQYSTLFYPFIKKWNDISIYHKYSISSIKNFHVSASYAMKIIWNDFLI